MSDDPAKDFHAHLDVCKQCERHPFDLCPVGARLINEAIQRLHAAGKTGLFHPGGKLKHERRETRKADG